MSSVKVYNMILLGESGTGKSLFINSFANFLHFKDLKEAVDSKQSMNPIVTKFMITDSNNEDRCITSGEEEEEKTQKDKVHLVMGQSSTVNCRSYMFQLGEVSVRLIDTPGVGDTRGEEVDRANVANILSFINNYKDLHAIGILMKNTETKMTPRFADCLKTLLTNLDKSAVNNIVFILTFAKGNEYKPGPIKDVIKLFIENELGGSKLSLSKEKMYCVDNRSYEYLVAVNKGVTFDKRDFDSHSISWECSSEEIARLIAYVSKLSPHKVEGSASLNAARLFINIVNPLLTEILKNIDSNTESLDEYKMKILAEDHDIKRTKSDPTLKLYELKTTELEKPITVCKSEKCRKVVEHQGQVKIFYPKVCCNGCYVWNGWRWWCEEMNFFGGCKKCGCNISEHERRFVKTEHVPTSLLSDKGIGKIKSAGERKEALRKEVENVEKKKMEMQKEMKKIENAEKKFAKFLRDNAISVPPDRRNRSYIAEQEVMTKHQRDIEEMEEVSVKDVDKLKDELKKLTLYGNHIKTVVKNREKGKKFVVDEEKTMVCKQTFESIVNSKKN